MPIEDLAQFHEIISDLFKLPTTAEEWNQYRLTDEHVSHFHEYGYLSGIKMLDDNQVEVLRKEVNELVDPKHPGHDLGFI